MKKSILFYLGLISLMFLAESCAESRWKMAVVALCVAAAYVLGTVRTLEYYKDLWQVLKRL